MYLKENTELCVMQAISPVHAGAGSATGAVDLPIQRERHTGWPHVQSSGVKGAFRDHCERYWMLQDLEVDKLVTKEKKDRAGELANRVFGLSEPDKSQAGAISFSDARLLAFPVRSNLAPFVWVVCPTLLKRLARDLELAGLDSGNLDNAEVASDSYCLLAGELQGGIILEDVCLNQQGGEVSGIIETMQELVPDAERLVLIPDNHFSFLMETATEVQAQIKIQQETGTTKDGSLRYQELLPADTFFYTIVFFGHEKAEEENQIVLDTLRAEVMKAASDYIQMGGDLTLGRGIFQLDWIKQKGGQG